MMYLTEQERYARQNEQDRQRELADELLLHGAYDVVVEPSTVKDLVLREVRDALREHLVGVYFSALHAAQEPFARELARVNAAFDDVWQAGVSHDEARRINRRIDRVVHQVAAEAEAIESARLRRLARAAERYALLRLEGRGKYVLLVQKGGKRANA